MIKPRMAIIRVQRGRKYTTLDRCLLPSRNSWEEAVCLSEWYRLHAQFPLLVPNWSRQGAAAFDQRPWEIERARCKRIECVDPLFSIGRRVRPLGGGERNDVREKQPSRFLGAGNNDSTDEEGRGGGGGRWRVARFSKLKLPEALRKLSDSRRHAAAYPSNTRRDGWFSTVGVVARLHPRDEFSTGSRSRSAHFREGLAVRSLDFQFSSRFNDRDDCSSMRIRMKLVD